MRAKTASTTCTGPTAKYNLFIKSVGTHIKFHTQNTTGTVSHCHSQHLAQRAHMLTSNQNVQPAPA